MRLVLESNVVLLVRGDGPAAEVIDQMDIAIYKRIFGSDALRKLVIGQ